MKTRFTYHVSLWDKEGKTLGNPRIIFRGKRTKSSEIAQAWAVAASYRHVGVAFFQIRKRPLINLPEIFIRPFINVTPKFPVWHLIKG